MMVNKSEQQQLALVESGAHELSDAFVHLWRTTDPDLGNGELALTQLALEDLLETSCHKVKSETSLEVL